MASTQKWRSYGGIGHFESNNNVSFNNLTVGNLSIKRGYVGNFSINGSLIVYERVDIRTNIRVGGTSEVYGNTSVRGAASFLNDMSIAGNLVVNKSVTINGQLNVTYGFSFENNINVNGNIGMAGKYIFFGPVNSTYNYGKLICNTNRNEKFIGINQPIETEKLLPGSMLEIYCDSSNNNGITALNAYSNSLAPTQSVIISNSEYQGTIFYMDPSKCSMYMFNDNTIPTTTTFNSGFKYVQPKIINSTNANPDSEITCKAGGDLLIRVNNNTFLTSKTVIGKSDIADVYDNLNEKVLVYTDPSNAELFNYSYYEISGNYNTNNGLTIIDETDFNESNVGLNLMTKNSTTGMKICGGSYILDTNKSIGSIGLDPDNCGNFIPVQTMITGNLPTYSKTATGINTYAPNTDYILNINGKTSITNGEITKIQDVSFELHGLVGCARNPDYIIGYGSPNVTVVTDLSSHKHPFIYTSDGGISWSIGDISGSISNGIHSNLLSANYVFSYDSNYSFVVYEGNSNLFYTSDGGNLWNIFVTDSSTVLTTTTIRVMDMSNSVMMAYTDTRIDASSNYFNYLSYGIMNDISYINLYCPDDGTYSYLSTNYFKIPSGDVTGMDSYDSNYIFITGSFGIYKYLVNPFLGTINSVGILCSNDNSYNSLYTYKTYTDNVLDPDPLYTVFVGNNCITTTYDGGTTLNIHDISGNFKSVYIYDTNYAIVVGNSEDGYGLIYVTWDGGQTWTNMSYDPIFNSSGVANLLTGSNRNLISVCIPRSSDNFLINRVDSFFVPTQYDNDGNIIVPGVLGSSKVFYNHFPNLFNIENNTVLDVCGSMFVDGFMKISKDLNILTGGSLYLNGTSGIYSEGSIYCSNTAPSTTVNTGALQIVGGTGIGGNLNVGGTIKAPVITQTSDYRIKSSVMELDDNYTVDNLNPIKYHNSLIGQDDIGFLAHEVQEIYPFLVQGEKDGENYQSLNYIGIIGILVKEIKELKKHILKLKTG